MNQFLPGTDVLIFLIAEKFGKSLALCVKNIATSAAKIGP
jgi:hypothetical protein